MVNTKYQNDVRSYFYAATISITAVFLQLLLKNLIISYSFILMYPAIVISSFLLGTKPATVTLVINCLSFIYFYTPFFKTGTMPFSEFLVFLIYLLCAASIVALIGKTKERYLSEDRLARATEATGIGVWELDIATNKLQRSPTHDQVYGIDYDPKHTLDFFKPKYIASDLIAVKESYQKMISSEEQVTLESRVIWPDGTIHWAELRGKRSGDKLIGTIMDITEAKRTNDILESIVTHSPLPLVVCNSDGIVKVWNPAAEKLFGWNAQETIGKKIPFNQNTILHAETTRKNKNGDIIDVIVSSSELPGTDDVLMLFSDLSGLRKAEKSRMTSEKLLQDVIDKSPYIIYLKDREGRYLRVNSQFYKFFGDEKIKVIGQTDYEIFPFEKAREYTINDFEVWKSNGAVTVEESIMINNELRTYISTKFPLIGAENERPYAIAGISVDITDRKNMENDLRFAVETRDKFLTIASHELKTPLTSMKLQLQVYRRQLQKGNKELMDESKLMKLISITLKQTSTLEKLVNDMLDISRINTGKLTYEFHDTDLDKLVSDVVDSLRDGIEAYGGTIDLKMSGHLHGHWDKQRIEQAIVNILTNASKYGKGKPIHVRVYQDGDYGKIAITDEGIGIANADHARIFEQFERAVNQNEVSGFGLGLYISRKIIHAHEGDITVQSEPGKGSTFIISLPVQKDIQGETYVKSGNHPL